MKLFITGISGLLGLNVALQTRARFHVLGCYRTHPIQMEQVQTLRLDVTAGALFERTLLKAKPDIIVHTAGLSNVEQCEQDPELAQTLNVEAARVVARIARVLNARLVHISTDHLFSGSRAWITEESYPSPLNVYARTKWTAEQVVQEECPDALIIRTNFFGWGTSVRTSFSDWILRGLADHRPLTMFSDVFFTPLLINDLTDAIIELIDREAAGVFHVAGSERLSKHEFALQLAEAFGYPSCDIGSISIEDFSFKAQRPKDMSLSSHKAEALLQKEMPAVGHGLKRLLKLRDEGGWPQLLEQAIQQGVASSGSE